MRCLVAGLERIGVDCWTTHAPYVGSLRWTAPPNEAFRVAGSRYEDDHHDRPIDETALVSVLKAAPERELELHPEHDQTGQPLALRLLQLPHRRDEHQGGRVPDR
jgi:hypothetical protein